MKQKATYLGSCLYIELIIDEGNNFRRNFPLYTRVISCDREFNWRIMFIGQADVEGKKDGASIWELVKYIFIDNGLESVLKKIVMTGTK